MATRVAMAYVLVPDAPGDALPEVEGDAVTSGGRVYGSGDADVATLLGDGLDPAADERYAGEK
jgi:hypothetical protein